MSFDKKIWYKVSVKTHEYCDLHDYRSDTSQFSNCHLYISNNFLYNVNTYSESFTEYFREQIDKNILLWKPAIV